MDVGDLAHPSVTRFYTSSGRPAGPWGRGGAVKGPNGIYIQTGDGLADPASGNYGESVLALAPKDLRLMDSFTPTNWQYLNRRDLDMGSANPLVFPFQKWTLLATAAKEGVTYLLDAGALGGGLNGKDRNGVPDHSTPLFATPRLGNDETLLGGRGVWGALATYQNAAGRRFVYVPMWGPPSKDAPTFKYSYGETPNGSIMAFEVTVAGDKPALVPAWMSRDMHVPDPPTVANGVLYAIQTGENTVQNPGRPNGDLAGGPIGAGFQPGGPGAGQGGRGAAGAGRGGLGGGRGGPGPGFALQAAKLRATPVSNLVLYAYDAETGKQLYSSEKTMSSWTHFSEPVVAEGKVFVVSWDAHVYAFGLKQ